jgi:hypothetical protein
MRFSAFSQLFTAPMPVSWLVIVSGLDFISRLASIGIVVDELMWIHELWTDCIHNRNKTVLAVTSGTQ